MAEIVRVSFRITDFFLLTYIDEYWIVNHFQQAEKPAPALQYIQAAFFKSYILGISELKTNMKSECELFEVFLLFRLLL